MDKILEFCGFDVKGHHLEQGYFYRHPDGVYRPGYPPLDMNFFFKYVVPKLIKDKKYPAISFEFTYDDDGYIGDDGEILKICCHISPNDTYYGFGSTMEKAWQEALLKLISETKKEARE